MIIHDYDDIPKLVNVKYLRGHDLLLSFANGEDRIVDMTDSFDIPAAYRYSPLVFFKDFVFNEYRITWGDEESSDCMDIGHDSLYNMSLPIDAFVSSVLSIYRRG